MKLDPKAKAIIDRAKAAGIPAWSSLSPVEGRRVYRARASLFGGEPTPMHFIEDRAFEGPATEVGIRIYHPTDESALPVLIYLHGGGWTLGDLDSHDELCRRLAVAAGCIVVSVDYRLSPEFPFPAPLDDCVAAIRWVADNADSFGGDSQRLAVGGDSAGGTMSAAACLRIRDEGGPRLALQLLIYPATRASFDTLSYFENATGRLLTRADMIWFWQNYLGDASPTSPYACPDYADNLSCVPRALIITAGFDPLRDEGEIYGIKLRAAGVPVRMRRFPGMMHGFIALAADLEASRQGLQLTASELTDAWAGFQANKGTRQHASDLA